MLIIFGISCALHVGEKLASTMQGEQEDVDSAVGAAREAFKTWSKLPGHVRARYLYSIARHVQKHARLIAVLESLDNGKPIRETRDADVQIVARHLYHHAGWAQLMDTEMRGKGIIHPGIVCENLRCPLEGQMEMEMGDSFTCSFNNYYQLHVYTGEQG